jgi:hypothetical protein
MAVWFVNASCWLWLQFSNTLLIVAAIITSSNNNKQQQQPASQPAKMNDVY